VLSNQIERDRYSFNHNCVTAHTFALCTKYQGIKRDRTWTIRYWIIDLFEFNSRIVKGQGSQGWYANEQLGEEIGVGATMCKSISTSCGKGFSFGETEEKINKRKNTGNQVASDRCAPHQYCIYMQLMALTFNTNSHQTISKPFSDLKAVFLI